MKLEQLLQALKEHNDKGTGYQIHLNSGNIETNCHKCTSIEFGDLYFTNCNTINNTTLLHFDNMNRNPIKKEEDGKNLYPIEINSSMFINSKMIETIEDVTDFQDWFEIPSTRVINIYLIRENKTLTGNRNIVTIGFM